MIAAKTSLQKFLMLVLALESAYGLSIGRAMTQQYCSETSSGYSTVGADVPVIALNAPGDNQADSQSDTGSNTTSSQSTSQSDTGSNTTNSQSTSQSDTGSNTTNSQSTSQSDTGSNTTNSQSTSQSDTGSNTTNSQSTSQTSNSSSSTAKTAERVARPSDDDDDDDDKPKKPAPKPTYVRNYNKPEPTTADKRAPGALPNPSANPTASEPLPRGAAEVPGALTRGGSVLNTPAVPGTGAAETTASTAATPEQPSQPAPSKEANLPVVTPPVATTILPFINQAYKEMGAGKYDAAITYLTDAIRRDPSCVQARRYLGYAMLKNNQPLEALQQIESVGKLMRLTPFDNSAMGEAYFVLGDYEQAYDAYHAALDANPNLDSARLGAIKSLSALNRYDEALKLCAAGAYATKDKKLTTFYRNLYSETAARRLAGHGDSQTH